MTKTVVWDYNGTILDDTDICVETMNRILKKRGLKLISKEIYLEIFGFPVNDYYEKAGLSPDKYSFFDLSAEYMEEYLPMCHNLSVKPEVSDILGKLQKDGFDQIILSASEITEVRLQAEKFGISDYFSEILGLSDIYANSKIAIAKNWREKNPNRELLYIGDTIHDFEVAETIGAECILVTWGHNNESRLQSSCKRAIIVNDLSKLYEGVVNGFKKS